MMMNLPTMVFDEAAAIDEVVVLVETIEARMTARYTRQWLEDELVDMLQLGTMTELRIISAAENGDEIADAALRRVYQDTLNHHQEASALLTAYGIKALGSAPLKRGRGHYWFDNWRRDIAIVVLVYLIHRRFNLFPTRNREQTRRQQPSAASILAAALYRKGIHVKESTVNNLWFGPLQGQLGRFLLTGQIAG
jgi:hypothetical protein